MPEPRECVARFTFRWIGFVNTSRLHGTNRDLTDRSSLFFINPVMRYVDRRALLMTENRCKRTELPPTPDHPCESRGSCLASYFVPCRYFSNQATERVSSSR